MLLVLVHFWASFVVVFWFFDGVKLPYLCMGDLSLQQFLRYIFQRISQRTVVKWEFCLMWDVSSFCFLSLKTRRWLKECNCKKLHVFHFNKQMLDYLFILFNIVHDKQLSNWWPGKYMIFQPSLLTRNPQVNMWNCNNEVHLGTCIYVFCESLLDGTPMNIVY
jgi:hypothetical protein